jgi:glutathione synthase/RimK-type ligase-like ATP-grasp enzyme
MLIGARIYQRSQWKDIRCFVIDGKVVAAIQRKAMPGEFRANIHLGGTASIIKLPLKKNSY